MASTKTYTGNDLEAALKKKGFIEKSSKHKHFVLYVDGKKTSVFTLISHGKKAYTDTLFNLVKKQLRLDTAKLRDLIDCPLTEQMYVDHLKSGGHI